MILLYREVNNGPARVVEVATRAEAVKYEPFLVMPDMASAQVLRNHLAGHDDWEKKLCVICAPATPVAPRPDPVLTAPDPSMAGAEARLKRRQK